MLTRRTNGPVGTFSDLRNELDRFFNSFDTPWQALSEFKPVAGEWAPAMEVSETANEVIVKTELPGVDPERIEVNMEGDVLTISGSKDETREQEDENVFHSERRYGSFMRRLKLSTDVDRDSIDAKFKNGVLRVRLTKKSSAKSRKIPVVGE